VSIGESGVEWGDMERKAKQHESETQDAFAQAGIPLVTVTKEDRLRGAIIAAMGQIETRCFQSALTILKEALKL
jgi:hypothetical protein